MIGNIDRDEREEKLCYRHSYGMKFKSYKLGMAAGKTDVRNKDLTSKTKCPYRIPEDVLELLKKRARWLAGYEIGWQVGRKTKKRRTK